MRNAKASVTTRVPTWIAWLSRPVCAWRNGKRIGNAKPTPPATLPKMNDKAKAAFLCSAVVWSAIIAFHAAKMPPSDTPATRAARRSHNVSLVTAKTRAAKGRTVVAARSGSFPVPVRVEAQRDREGDHRSPFGAEEQ